MNIERGNMPQTATGRRVCRLHGWRPKQLGIATVVGCRELSIDVGRELVRFGGHEIAEGALITVDGDRGLVFEGELTTTIERPTALIERVRAWRASATNGYATTLTAPAS
jgi:phosphoenolpyruvate synthase/pyruvate phosphate dikinase